MKKILLIVFVFLLMLGCNDVFAKSSAFSGAEFLDGVSYVKFDGSYYYFRNAQVIRNVDTGNVAYCLEPFSALIDGSVYNGYDVYNSLFNLSKEQWDRINLLAHYGYGYGNHVEDKWITVTQFLIWRTVDLNSSFNWIDNLNNRNIIYPYQDEILELETLVNNHYILPEIAKKIIMGSNSVLTFIDVNNVLSKYEIVYSDFDSYIEGNNLIINSKEKKVGKIKFRLKQYSNDNVHFFYSNNTQSVVESGNVDPIYFEIDVEVIPCKLTIKKVDSDTMDVIPQGSASLIGAVYEVFDSQDKTVGEIVIGDNNIGILDNLAFGDYYVKEKKSGDGYYVDNQKHSFSVDINNREAELILDNKVISSKIKIIKYYGSIEDFKNNNLKPEANIKFGFFDINNTLIYSGTTDENGIIETELPYGEYTVKQVNTTPGYSFANNIKISVNELSNISITHVLKNYKIDVPNAGIVTSFFELINQIKEMFFV